MLSLWSSIGSAIGAAIAGAIWNSKMPDNLRKHMPDSVSDEQIGKFFEKMTALHLYPFNSETSRYSSIFRDHLLSFCACFRY